jgi:hypothetical protein
MAQVAQPQPGPAAAPAPPAQPSQNPAFRPGFIDAFGRWLDKSKTKLDESIGGTRDAIGGIGSQATDAVKGAGEVVKGAGDVVKGAGDAVKGAGEAVKGAAGAAQQATGMIVGLPGTRVVIGRQRCQVAPNGAPDCQPAAVALCRYRGFSNGRGLDIDSGQKCPAWVWLSGQTPADGACHTETYVTRAVCQ